MAPKRRGRPRGGRKDQGTPSIPGASPSAQAAPQEGGTSNPQIATFVQELMVEIRRQASLATTVPPPAPVVSTPTTPAPISPVPISSAPAVSSWKVYTEFQKVVCHASKPEFEARQTPCTRNGSYECTRLGTY
ncbi:hypothetical protein SLEP1_g47908 [Rubroshorea leprosula]|uniref:Uncharacterized protein n=1 Tax=Rubroshorea leprosula TaxID=152421 RepID=A0AAV5LTT5_9ROSI|nr:hypothetical protein SLEP1_g47908 [Rubroshorea leprosula]